MGHERPRSLVGIPRHGEGANPEGVAVPWVEPRRADAPEARRQELAATAKESVDRVLAELGDLEDGGVFHGASVAPSGWSTNRGKYVKLRAQPSRAEAPRCSVTHLATWARGPHGAVATDRASGVRSLAAALRSRSAYRGSVSAIAHPIPATWSVVDRVSPRSTSSSPARKAASAFSRVPKSSSR